MCLDYTVYASRPLRGVGLLNISNCCWSDEIFGNWYSSPTVRKLYRDLPEREYTVIADGEDLGGVSLKIDQGWLEVPGPDCMNGVSVTVWDMALASLRRETKHIEKLVEPVVLRAIGFAQDADNLSRKRLGIRYRLKTPEELEELRNSIGHAVRFAADRNPRPSGPVDMFAGGIAVGTKAPRRDAAPALPPSAAEPPPAPAGKRAKPKAPRAKTPKSTTETSARKPPRQWKPKERK
jgi:hypothetical protein